MNQTMRNGMQAPRLQKCRFLKGALLLFSLFAFNFSPSMAQVSSPCPEVLINEKYDHVALPLYRANGWDTAVTCTAPTIELSAEPYIPVQFFNGTYTVEEIPYNPPDTTFHRGTQLDINCDDIFAPSATQIAYPFYFFGIRKTQFRLGDNGMITFSTENMTDVHCSPNKPYCPYQAPTTPMPWTTENNGTPGGATYFSRMHDAIYGVYEDSHPLPSTVTGNQGIYYGVIDEYPCRKIIASWNEIPLFSSQTNNRQTYQIVCYEGSNIIEVHVKRRGCCSSTNSGRGFIGIQNATGLPQVKSSDIDAPNFYVVNGSPAAFVATGWNPKEVSSGTTYENFAFRFTPQGNTSKNCKWYRIFDDGRDSVDLTSDQNDTNGYVSQQMSSDPTVEHATLTKATVSPKCVSRYVCELRFMNANNDWYFLRDTVTIGIDTTNEMTLSADGHFYGNYQYDICQGHTTQVNVAYPDEQVARRVDWNVYRVLNGEEIELPTSMYSIGGNNHMLSLRPDQQADTLPRNKIDTLYVQSAVEFISGCQNYKRLMVRVFPNFDTVITEGICNGQTFTWHPCDSITKSYTSNTNPENTFVLLHSSPGCDSLVHLALTVFDVSLTYDDVTDCQPYTWRNGQTYSESNTGSSAIDTVILKNAYDCDSVVQLRFTLIPVTSRIKSSLDHFDFDHLDVVLTDISSGNDSRRWKFPTAGDQTGATAYYSIPVSESQAHIWLLAYSQYGCVDSTDIIIPFNKESFWVPNAFTPDDPAGNNIFSSTSSQTINQEMFIYNRLGDLIFKCEGADCGWDGKNLNGDPCPQGAYVYMIRYSNSFEPKIVKVKRGTVTLIR